MDAMTPYLEGVTPLFHAPNSAEPATSFATMLGRYERAASRIAIAEYLMSRLIQDFVGTYATPRMLVQIDSRAPAAADLAAIVEIQGVLRKCSEVARTEMDQLLHGDAAPGPMKDQSASGPKVRAVAAAPASRSRS